MVCIYRGPNGTIGYHYPMFKFSECPKTYMCRYTPNAKKKVSVQDILDGLKGRILIMTAMQFQGFKPQAMERIAGTLGYQGDMGKFKDFYKV